MSALRDLVDHPYGGHVIGASICIGIFIGASFVVAVGAVALWVPA